MLRESKMGELFHLYLVVCLCLTRSSVHTEEITTPSKCQVTADGSDTSDCALNGTAPASSSPLPKSSSSSIATTSQNGTENGRARAMNYTLSFQDAMRNNGLETGSLTHKVPGTDFKEHSIDDVSMEDMNDDVNLNYTGLIDNFRNMMNVVPMVKNTTVSNCVDNNKTYKVGEKFNRGCNESCQCVKAGEIMCGSICKPPYQVKGRNKDPSCIEVAVEGNSCCVLINCPAVQDLDAEPMESCYHKNETYRRGSTFNDTCDVCICEAGGRVNCKSRCPRIQNTTGNCLAVQDPDDPCCKRILCDVEEHDVNKVGITAASDESAVSSSTTDNQIISAKPLNGTSVSLSFAEKTKDCNVEVSENGVDWSNMICIENTVGGLEPGKKYQIRLKNTASNKIEVTLPASNRTSSSTGCSYKGKSYKIGEEFHDGCDAYCICENSRVDCAPIECPTDFGLDVLDPHCLDWEMHPPDFTPTPPYCCPDKIRCKDNGSCTYNGENYPNWSELPVKATGCEKRCYCEMGNVTCSPMCPKISSAPPKDLLCPPEQAVLQKPPDDECCFQWTCPNVGRPGNETIKSEKKEHATNKLEPTEFTKNENDYTSTAYSTDETTKPNSIDRLTTVTYTNTKKPTTNSKNTTDKKEFYPGPFSPQYFAKNENSSSEKATKKPTHGMLADLLSPFHLEKFAPEIEKNIYSNDTTTSPINKKPGKKPTKGYHQDEDEEEEEEDVEDHYDEKNQYEHFFTDLFDPKSKNKNSSKHSIWDIKAPEIPPFVKNPNLPESEYGKEKSTTESGKHSETPGEFPKKHIPNGSKEGNKKQKPQFDQDKPYEVKISDQGANNFLPYPNIPYTIPENVYPNVNPHLKYPPSEILIHQAPQNPNLNYNNKYKPAPINDPNQSEEFYHIIDNDAYNDEQIRQNLHYGQHEIHPQFGHVVKLTKDGVRLQNPNEPNTQLNVEDVLTHLHHETSNNVHLPNILPGGPPRHQVPMHNFGFQNYHETLNADQTSHPLLLQPELLNQHNNTNRDEVKIHILEAVDENTVKLVFSVPQVLVGLHGRVELRYTSDQQNNEPSTWEQQILAPPDDLIATAELEFELTGLHPNTTYKIKISVVMSDVGNAPTSNILTIRTPAAGPSPTTLPPIIPVEPDLRAIEVNATYVKVGWRMFSETELQFIDGVQLRYKELDDKVYAATPLIHRAVTTYTIEQLKPNSIYEIGIFFIPFPGQTTELQAQKTIQIRTGLEFDPYKFDIMVEVHHIKASSIEISWSGVPYPEDKYVNIFRAIYQSDGSREDFSTFKVAKRDSSQNILIQDLKPGTRYRLWLEAYLTNGRTKKSNVKDFITKIGPAIPPSTSQGKLEGTPLVEANSYYGPLVAVSILAAIAITSTIILILILAKKHGTIKAPITTPINRKNNSSAAYDNQAYKTYENDRNGSKAGSIALTVFPKTHVEKEA